MGNIITSPSITSRLPPTKTRETGRQFLHSDYQLDSTEINSITALLDEVNRSLRGEPDENGLWFVGAYEQATDPIPYGTTPAGLGTSRAHLFRKATGFGYRRSGQDEFRRLHDDRGLGIVELDSYAGATLAPAGKFWLRANAGTPQYSYDGGAWAAFGGGLAAGDNITWTGTHVFEGSTTIDTDPTITGDLSLEGELFLATGVGLWGGANQLVSGNKLQAIMLAIAGMARGDFLKVNAAGTAFERLAVGAAGTVLAGGTDPAYTADPTVTSLTLTSTMKLLSWTSDRKLLAMGEASGSPSYRGVKGQEGSGTNIGGGAFRVVGGQGTGTATGGAVEFWHAVKTSNSGTALSTLVKTFEMTAPTDVGDGTGTPHSDFVPAVSAKNNIGTSALRMLDGYFDQYIFANRFGSADDTNSYLEFDEADGASVYLGGTQRAKLAATYLRLAFGATLADAFPHEVVTNAVDGRGLYRSTSASGYGGVVVQADGYATPKQMQMAVYGSSLGEKALLHANALLLDITSQSSGGKIAFYTGGGPTKRAEIDTDETAGYTALLLSVAGAAPVRVKVGANGSGSIAAHRMLQVPDA